MTHLSFTAVAIECELHLLRQLHAMLAPASLSSRGQFTDLMRAAFQHARLDARALSDDLSYSFSTVHRWIDGRTAPHPSLWPRIAEWISAALASRIAAVEAL
jgi:hypothetical protein